MYDGKLLIGTALMHKSSDDGPNMETYHEGTYRSSRVGHVDFGRSPRERGCRQAWQRQLSLRAKREMLLAGAMRHHQR
jgi:hypothetical protein